MTQFIGNIIWLVFGGFTAALGTMSAGIATCTTIIGIPFGLKQISVGAAMTLPFGREVRTEPELSVWQVLANAVWFVSFGWALVLNHLVFGILLTLTVVGIPFAKQHWKLLELSAFPFGKSFESAPRKRQYEYQVARHDDYDY